MRQGNCKLRSNYQEGTKITIICPGFSESTNGTESDQKMSFKKTFFRPFSPDETPLALAISFPIKILGSNFFTVLLVRTEDVFAR